MKVYVFILFLLIGISISAKENKIYVKGIETNLSEATVKKIENILLLSIIRNYPEANVFSDDASLSVLKQGKLSQSIGADSEFLQYLGNSLNFQELITSNLQKNASNFQFSIQSIKLGTKENDFSIQNKVYFEFKESEINFIIPEMVKALKDKKYSILKTPISNSNIDLTEIILPQANNVLLEPKQFESKDSLPITFLEGVSNYIEKADTEYKNKNYLEALNIYLKILETIKTLENSTEKNIKNITQNIQKRANLSAQAAYSELIKTKDQTLPKDFSNTNGDLIFSFFQGYIEDWKKYKDLPNFAKTDLIERNFKSRTMGLMKIYLSRLEKAGDEKYNLLQFKEAIEEYKKIESVYNPYSDLLDLRNYQKLIQSKIKTTKESATSYTSSKVRGYLQFAESENARAVLEKNMQNTEALLDRKNSSLYFLKEARSLIVEYREFVDEQTFKHFESISTSFNLDNERHTFITPQNIALAPVRYIGNIFRGISDIFIFKWGYGIGIGSEFFVFGLSPILYNEYFVETSTAYGIQTEYSKGSELSSIDSAFQDKEKNIPNMGKSIGFYGVYTGNCPSYFFRMCRTQLDKENTDYRKYTTLNVSIGFGPSVYFGLELHRIPEFFGVLIFQDWDLLNQKKIAKPSDLCGLLIKPLAG
ncbi:MAG TPA: hypothetical protein PKX55_23845, partial [Leptospiraceae bacterium]|nr:hypothetical protein [Leptospiraceae bacterium]